MTQPPIQQITCQQLAEKLQQQPAPLLLDVRQEQEVALCQIAGSRHIAMHLIPLYLDQLTDEQEMVVYCHLGARSQAVIAYLIDAGFDAQKLYNLQGGIDSWAKEIEPNMVRY